MRKKSECQQQLQSLRPNWQRQKEYLLIDQILSENPEIEEIVLVDLIRGKNPKRGAPGMTAAQVLRCALVKQMEQLSYEDLCDRIDDSERLRAFTRFGDKNIPKKSTMQDNIKKLRPETLELVNEKVLEYAREENVEDGRKVRIDSTAVESDIHYPTDNSLLADGVRVLTRILKSLRDEIEGIVESFHDHTRRANKRDFEITYAKRRAQRESLYADLLDITENVVGYAEAALARLQTFTTDDFELRIMADVHKEELEEVLPMVKQCIDQCHRRVMESESVPAGEKLVSIFEPHADIIVKGQRDPTFGHKICLTGGQSNMIIGCIIERGNTADTKYFSESLDCIQHLYGNAPEQLVTDGGFHSPENVEDAKARGVENILLSKGKKNKLTELAGSVKVYRKLRKFRAGIEGCISAMKRSCGLGRCTWSGWTSFKSYVWLSVVSFNLQVFARALLKRLS